ncbi:MAG: hydroxymethylglutaryl-CoA lyase [Phycisphaeraceae bacterium]|nr:hydroxymethylglutaryl-CoA lyase [Phycisphaeraceae bacterium]
MTAARGERVRIVEVGPRDGLQNESRPVPTDRKIAFIRALAAAGLREIEAASFVHPKAVPQLADAADVLRGLDDLPEVRISALVPNERGLDRALAAGVRRIAVFTAASETFVQRNIGMSIEASLQTFRAVLRRAVDAGVTARGYVSTAFVCPYEGEVAPADVALVTERLLELGCDEVAISDTIGVAAPTDVTRVCAPLLRTIAPGRIALHLHDTCGTALANVVRGLDLGIRTFDASAGGLGGCPFAPGAAGNLATEDLVYLLDRMGFDHGVRLAAVLEAAALIADVLDRAPTSRQWRRLRGPGCGAA